MARKTLNELVGDLKAGLSLASERVAEEITLELKRRGPYYTGDFEKAWVVRSGQVRVMSDLPGRSLEEDIGRQARQVTPVTVPPADDRMLGYTIANRMEYADIAMDLEPSPRDGNYRYERFGADTRAIAGWFELYMLGGEGSRTIATATKDAMGLAGFRR